jgi:hypothetical protein
MADPNPPEWLDAQIEQWRRQLRGPSAGDPAEIARAEQQLRGEIADLTHTGLAVDEAFLVAMKRMSTRGGPAAEFAREQADRGWKQLIAPLPAPGSSERSARARRDGVVAFSLAVLAAVAVKVPALLGVDPAQDANAGFYLRNAGLFVLPCLIGYFAWKRQLAPRTIGWLAVALVAAAAFANLPVFGAAHEFEQLTALHLPIALLLGVGVAYAGGRWREVSVRMDFIRFSGELFIYYVLIALGGGVLCAFIALTFKSIGINPGPFFAFWLLPCGAAGALIIASWLVEAKKGVLENMAPMLTRIFTPLFAAMLVAFLGALLFSRRGIAIERELLIGFDLLLVVVLGLLLYSLSARNPLAPPGAFDVLQIVLLVAALLADIVALWAIGARISEFGFSPNRVAALGENVILLVNLAWSAVLYVRFLLGRGSFPSLERWQTGYVPVYATWAALVVIVFPPAFRWFA